MEFKSIKSLTLLVLFFRLSVEGDQDFVKTDNNGFAFASYYQDNMVLQMKPHRAVVWGYGTVGSVVKLSFGKEMYSAKVVPGFNKTGVWKVLLQAQPAGGPHRIQAIEEGNVGLHSQIALENVLFGDVWVCSGQSNMGFTVPMGFDAVAELALASSYPNIRLMTPAGSESDVPLSDLRGIQQPWSLPSAESLSGPQPFSYFSAVCWYYGKYLYDSLNIPIGLVSPTWVGTSIETWSSPSALKRCGLEDKPPKMKKINGKLVKPDYPTKNSVLWNAMIRPLLNMTIKGAIWYQGEGNWDYHNAQYNCSFPAMIVDWRRSWFEGTGQQTHAQFPFGFVQISTVTGVTDFGTFPPIRWHQTADYGYVPNPKMPKTFMAVAMDLGDPTSPYGSIHPRDKQDVAYRLVLGALRVAYERPVEHQGPFPQSAERTGDNNVVVTYPNKQKLVVAERGNFEVCCSVSKCNYTEPPPSSNWLWAPITSYTHRSVTVSARGCVTLGGHAAFIRYAWQLDPCRFKNCSVYNDQGLPAPPMYLEVVELG